MAELEKAITMPKVVFEVVEVAETWVTGRIRESDGRIYGVSIPKFMCPEIACIPGGAFYIQTETVDPVEERKKLDELFKGL